MVALLARASPTGSEGTDLLLLSDAVLSRSVPGGASQPILMSTSPETLLLVFDEVTVLQKGCANDK